jgi:hypothetical protein
MTAGATKSGASLVTRTLIVKFLSEVRGLKNNNYPDIARDFGSYSRRGHGCILKYSGVATIQKTRQIIRHLGELFVISGLSGLGLQTIFSKAGSEY